MTPEVLSIIMFFTTLGLLLFGFPVAFTLAGSALIFGFIDFIKGNYIISNKFHLQNIFDEMTLNEKQQLI